MEFSPLDIKTLSELLKTEGENSSSEEDLPQCSKLGPRDINPKNKVKIRVPTEDYEHSENTPKKRDSKAIWDVSEVHVVPFCDDASYDPRQRPEFNISYRQAVTSEDVFLQLGNKTSSTASCEVMVVAICMKGEEKEDIDLHVTKQHLDLRSPQYRLSMPLPHPVNPDASSAEWEPKSSVLTVALYLNREFDFVNF